MNVSALRLINKQLVSKRLRIEKLQYGSIPAKHHRLFTVLVSVRVHWQVRVSVFDFDAKKHLLVRVHSLVIAFVRFQVGTCIMVPFQRSIIACPTSPSTVSAGPRRTDPSKSSPVPATHRAKLT
eukprot:526908-Rhodomonas_salina.1